MSARAFQLDMSTGNSRLDRMNSRQVGRLHKWNGKEARVKSSQTARKRVGVKLDRRRLKELLAEEPLVGEMSLEEENSLRSDLHMPHLMTEEERLEEARYAFLAWQKQYCEDEEERMYLQFLERLDRALLKSADEYDERELANIID